MTPKNKKEEWRERFEKMFSVASFTWNGDNATGLKAAKMTQRNVKSFLASELALARKEERERIVEDYIKHLVENECKGGHIIDWSKAKRVIFPNLQLTRKPISLRITTSLLAKVKVVANKKDMPYQTLMKQYISKGVEAELHA